MKIKIGEKYFIYGRVGKTKRMRPLSGNEFAVNLINAEIFEIKNEIDLKEFKYLIEYLINNNNGGKFEARLAKF